MQTTVHEVADGIFRFSTFVEPANLTFNQYLIRAEQPLLFHCGMRGLFPLVSQAVKGVLPLEQLRWISFGHIEADESGAMNHWLEQAPNAQLAFGQVGCMVSLNDLAARPPHALADGEVLDLGGKRVRYFATPHVPHNWEAGLLFEETTHTLLCGDLFTRLGPAPALSAEDPVGPALAAEDAFHASALTPSTAPTMRRLAQTAPRTLALMHGPAFAGDGAAALNALADAYEARFQAARGAA